MYSNSYKILKHLKNNCLPNYYIRSFKNTSVEDVPGVTPSQIKRLFKLNNVNYEEGYTCFTTDCPMCNLTKPQTKIYINKTTGLFSCPACKYYGDWDKIECCISSKKTKKTNILNISDIDENSIKLNNNIKQIQDNTVHLKDMLNTDLSKVWENLNVPKNIDVHLLENLNIRVDKDLKNIFIPLSIANSDIVTYKVFGPGQNKLTQFNYGGLIIGTKPKSKDNAIVVSNIADFLILYTSNLNYSIICLPNGIKRLPQQDLPALEKFKKIILWLGNDVKSCDAARSFGKKLGEKRCLHVRPSKHYAMPHENPLQDFKSIIGQAQNLSHKAITTFATLRQEVLSDLQNLDQVQGIKWNRFPTLNKIIKGHRLGELTVITGPTGSGKTTFISEYSLDLAMQGVNTLWGSFEIRNARLARTMLQQMVGMPLDQNLELFDYWADQFEMLPIYYMTFHGQQSIKVVMEAVEHATYVHDINHVIIDNVQFMMGITDEAKHLDRFWKQDAIIAEFRSFATKKNCHVTLVIHPRKERVEEDLTTSSIFGGAKASQEADNVLIIQDKRLSTIKGKKYLQIAKNRYSGDLGIMPLEFDRNGLSYAQKKKQKSDKLSKESEEKVEVTKSENSELNNQQS